jgi:hypothetical protein
VKVIFLDIDGVLCTTNEFLMDKVKFHKKNFVPSFVNMPYPFNSRCVGVLNEILLKTDAEIILSSDWRMFWDLKKLDLIFRFSGVVKSPIDVTVNDPVSMNWLEKNRANEIGQYLLSNREITKWVAIDDLNMKGFMKLTNDEDRMFVTNGNEGIKMSGLKEKIILKINE